MQVVFATPTCRHVRTLATKTINVIRNLRANVRRNFDGDESSKSIHRLQRWEIGHEKAQDAQTENRSSGPNSVLELIIINQGFSFEPFALFRG